MEKMHYCQNCFVLYSVVIHLLKDISEMTCDVSSVMLKLYLFALDC